MAIRVGILGLGAIGQTHARVIKKFEPDLVLAGYSCADNQAEELAKTVSAKRYSVEDLVSSPEIDLVVITSPSNLHAQHALAVINAGKMIVIEKPMTTTAQSAKEVVDAWRKSGKFGSVMAQRRFEPQHLAIKKLLDAGELGRPLMCHVDAFWWRSNEYYQQAPWRTQPPGGGVLMNQALHSVDLLTWLMGPAKSVCAINGNLVHKMAAEDSSIAAVEFASGALGSVMASTATKPGKPACLELRTTAGSLRIEHATITDWNFSDVACPEITSETTSGSDDPQSIGDLGHEQQWTDIVTALKSGGRPMIDLAEGFAAVELIDGIYRSAATGQRIQLGGLL